MLEKNMVSIIVPIYNQEKFLHISIPDLLKQSYKYLDIILVNDGSTDKSKDIIEGYQKEDKRIRIINQKNEGLVGATLAGINIAQGEYICFLDPDDSCGEDFIYNFISKIEDCDFIAEGYYLNNNGIISPYLLKENRVYEKEELRLLRNEFINEGKGGMLSNSIFISRWNKLYKTECVKKIAEKFSECRGISLGEDSLFTYLLLNEANKGKTIVGANSYYYNIGNQSSMMKNTAISEHFKKAKLAYEKLMHYIVEYQSNSNQAVFLYYYLIESLIRRLEKQNNEQFDNVYRRLIKDKIYRKALMFSAKNSSFKSRIRSNMMLKIKSPQIYRNISKLEKNIRQNSSDLKWKFINWKTIIQDIFKMGFKAAIQKAHFRRDRRYAFTDLNENLPKLEERITPFLKKYQGMTTDLEKCSIERNVFVFWWDGFENAPVIVKKCFETVCKYFSDCEIIQVTKDTYQQYTDINPALINGFRNGKISIQTFSDILRFNLLNKNGGVWIDATIFFTKEYNLLDRLKEKTFESVCFSNSKNFLEYKNCQCSWSGYFMASRKHAVLVDAMNYIFEQYYMKYHTFSIYFFIDAALMICKINGIDNNCLGKVHTNPADMSLMARVIGKNFDELYIKEFMRVPQKLAWAMSNNKYNKNSVYDICIGRD